MQTDACGRLTEAWDTAVATFLDGGPAIPPQFERWARGYQGRGRGEVVWDAFPEPFLGSLDRRPGGVFLALNPGRAHLDFQGRYGVFADEIRAAGSYATWAASWPYLRNPWVSAKGRNRHHASRLTFLRRWLHSEDLVGDAMVGFELYPWHSTSVTAAMKPDRNFVRQWVWEPLVELNAPVFAFGAACFHVLEDALGLKPVVCLGAGGKDYGSTVESRAVTVYKDDASGVTVIAERHQGGAGPPSSQETNRLHDALQAWT